MNELYPSQELDGHREDSLKVSTDIILITSRAQNVT